MAQDKENKSPNVPPLRFPEFSGNWEIMKIGELLDFYSTNSLSWDQLNYEGGFLRNLHYGLIHKGMSTLIDTDKIDLPFITTGYEPKKYTKCLTGDVAFADASEDTNDVGKAVEFIISTDDQNIICGLHTLHGRDKVGKTAPGFKGYAFRSASFRNQIRRLAQGTKVFSISTKVFDEIYIGVPSIAEQAKISRLLQLLDERIATQNKIIEKLQSLIKGLNDRLHQAVKGDLISFSELGVSYSGLSGKSSDDFGHGSPYITYLNVYQNDVVDEQQIGCVAIDDHESQNTVSFGDVLFTLSSETPAEVGIGSVYLGPSNTYYLNSFCFGITITATNKVYPPYLAYLVTSTNFRKFVYPLAQGSTRFNLHKNDFMKKKFRLPNFEIQRQIADSLNALRAQLLVESRLSTLYLRQKDFFINQLFI